MLAVRSVAKAGRRRAGRGFGPEPVELATEELTDDEIAALLGDPQLTVEPRPAAEG